MDRVILMPVVISKVNQRRLLRYHHPDAVERDDLQIQAHLLDRK